MFWFTIFQFSRTANRIVQNRVVKEYITLIDKTAQIYWIISTQLVETLQILILRSHKTLGKGIKEAIAVAYMLTACKRIPTKPPIDRIKK